MSVQQNAVTVTFASRKERAISNGKIERPDNCSYLYSPFCLQKTFTYTLALNPYNNPMGGHIIIIVILLLSHLSFIWEKLKFREVK